MPEYFVVLRHHIIAKGHDLTFETLSLSISFSGYTWMLLRGPLSKAVIKGYSEITSPGEKPHDAEHWESHGEWMLHRWSVNVRRTFQRQNSTRYIRYWVLYARVTAYTCATPGWVPFSINWAHTSFCRWWHCPDTARENSFQGGNARHGIDARKW